MYAQGDRWMLPKRLLGLHSGRLAREVFQQPAKRSTFPHARHHGHMEIWMALHSVDATGKMHHLQPCQ